jgi:hypothetical protein
MPKTDSAARLDLRTTAVDKHARTRAMLGSTEVHEAKATGKMAIVEMKTERS